MGLSESCRSWRPGSRGVGTSGTSDFEKTAGWSRAAFLCICRKNHTSMSNTLGQKQASWGHAYDEAVMTLASCYACVPALACCRSIIATAMATYTQLHLGGALTRSLLDRSGKGMEGALRGLPPCTACCGQLCCMCRCCCC